MCLGFGNTAGGEGFTKYDGKSHRPARPDGIRNFKNSNFPVKNRTAVIWTIFDTGRTERPIFGTVCVFFFFNYIFLLFVNTISTVCNLSRTPGRKCYPVAVSRSESVVFFLFS